MGSDPGGEQESPGSVHLVIYTDGLQESFTHSDNIQTKTALFIIREGLFKIIPLFFDYEQTFSLSGSSHRNRRSIRFMIIRGFSHRRSASWIKSSDTWDCSFSFISYFIDKTIKTLYHPLMFFTLI